MADKIFRALTKFNPFGEDYDYETAKKAGFQPDETGHWPSRAPLPEEETKRLNLPKDSGVILKGSGHKTFDLTRKGEADAGYKIIEKEGRLYSIPDNSPRFENPSEPGLLGRMKSMLLQKLPEVIGTKYTPEEQDARFAIAGSLADDISDEHQRKTMKGMMPDEKFALQKNIYDNLDDFLEERYNISTPAKQNEKMFNFILTSSLALSGLLPVNLGLIPASKHIPAMAKTALKYGAINEGLKRTLFPAIRATGQALTGQEVDYQRTGLADAVGADKGRVLADIAEIAMTAGAMEGVGTLAKGVLKNPKISGKIQEIRYNISKLMGKKIPTEVVPYDYAAAVERGDMSLAEAAKKSRIFFDQELQKRIVPENAPKSTITTPETQVPTMPEIVKTEPKSAQIEPFKQTIEKAGGVFKGIQEGFTKKDGSKIDDMILFNNKQGSTLAIKKGEFTPEAVAEKLGIMKQTKDLVSSRGDFIKKANEFESPDDVETILEKLYEVEAPQEIIDAAKDVYERKSSLRDRIKNKGEKENSIIKKYKTPEEFESAMLEMEARDPEKFRSIMDALKDNAGYVRLTKGGKYGRIERKRLQRDAERIKREFREGFDGIQKETAVQPAELKASKLVNQNIVTIDDANNFLKENNLTIEQAENNTAAAIDKAMQSPAFQKLSVFDKIRVAAQLERVDRDRDYSTNISINQKNKKTQVAQFVPGSTKKVKGSEILASDTIKGCDNNCFECYAPKKTAQAGINHQNPVKAKLSGKLTSKQKLRIGNIGDPAKDWNHTAQEIKGLIERNQKKGHIVSSKKNVYAVTKLQSIEQFDPKAIPNLEVSLDPMYPAQLYQSIKNMAILKDMYPEVNIVARIRAISSRNGALQATQDFAVETMNKFGIPVLETKMRFRRKSSFQLLELDETKYIREGNQWKSKKSILKGKAADHAVCDDKGTGLCVDCQNCVKMMFDQREQNISKSKKNIKAFFDKLVKKLKDKSGYVRIGEGDNPTPEDEAMKEIEDFFDEMAEQDRREIEKAPDITIEDAKKDIDGFKKMFDNLAPEEQEWLAFEAQEEIDIANMKKEIPDLFKVIKKLGGVKSYSAGFLSEELREIPLYLRNNETGSYLDDLVDQVNGQGFNYANDEELRAAIKDRAENPPPKDDVGFAKWIIKRFDKNVKAKQSYTASMIKKIGKILSSPVSRSNVKKLTREATGQIKVSDLVREDDALKEALRKEALGARREYKRGKTEMYEHMLARIRRDRNLRKTRNEVKAMLARIKSIDTKKMSPANKSMIDQIREKLDYTNISKKKLHELQRIREYMQNNPESEMPDYIMKQLERLDKVQPEQLTFQQLQAVHDTIMHYVHLEKTKRHLWMQGKQRDQAQAVVSSVKEMRPPKNVKKDIVESPNVKMARLKSAGETLARIVTINQDHYDLLVESIAGEDSATFDILFKQVKDGIRKDMAFRQKMFDKFLERFKSAKISSVDAGVWRKEKVLSGRFNLTRAQRISMYLHSMNENNLRHILEGGFVFKDDPYKNYKISEKEFDDLMKSITDEEKAVAAINYELEDDIWKAINEVFYEKNMYEAPREDMYFRIKVARAFMAQGQEEQSIIDKWKNQFVRIGLSKGFLNERINSKLPIVLEDFFEAWADHTMQAAAYIGLEIPLTNASKLLYDPTWKSNFILRYGKEQYDLIQQALRDIAGEWSVPDDIEAGFSKVKNNVTKGIFGLNPTIIVKQTLSFSLFNVYVDAQHLASGVTDFVMHPKEVMARHRMYSVSWRERVEKGFSRDVNDVFKGKSAQLLTGEKTSFTDKTLGGIRFSDMGTVAIGMQGAVNQELAKLEGVDIPMSEKLERAYRFADYVVDRTQPSFALEHRSAMSRSKNPFVKIMTFATSATNQQYNLMRRTYKQWKRTGKSEDFAKFMKAIIYSLLLINAGSGAIDYIADATYRKKKAPKLTPGYVGKKLLTGAASNVYILRDLASVMVSAFEYGSYGAYDLSNPVESYVRNTVISIAEIWRGVADRDEKKIMKGLDGIIDAVSVGAFGFPYGNVKRVASIPFREDEKKTTFRALGGKKKTTFRALSKSKNIKFRALQ